MTENVTTNIRATEMLVEAYDLTRTYRVGDELVVAVAHADCVIPSGARIALEGRSGSGKSTLLQILGGIETPTAGTIAWPALGPRETLRPRRIAFVFQRESLLAPLTVLENVALPLILAGAIADDARAEALDALERFDLAELREKLPEELSGGQSQRVAFARAIAQRPRLVLADEPTGQLDTETAERFLTTALASLDRDGTALVVATHDARVAARMRVRWRMERGRLETAP
jgi:putative ABC transport system ATP-binding protein/lipoprotein-releasing system ATP-binding protein